MMIVKDAMHDHTVVPSKASIAEAARLMDEKVIGSVLVEEGGRIIGIMTERDILRRIVAAGKSWDSLTVKDMMNAPVLSIDASAFLEDASDIMAQHKIRRLVVKEDEEIVGMITTRTIAEKTKRLIARRLAQSREYSRPSYAGAL